MTGAWATPPARLVLTDRHVDVWRTALDLPQPRIDEYSALLSRDEAARARRFKVPNKRREYIISRGLLRRILGHALRSDPAMLEFRYGEHDKPYLVRPPGNVNVNFNISHSHEQTLIAVTLDHALGIDIEHVRPDVQFRQLARRFFSAQEARALEACSEAALPRAFYACWTRKEAFVKALGDGISFGLQEFSVSVDPLDETVTLTTHWDPDEAGKWTLINIPAGEDYIAALAIEGKDFKIRLWEF
jgi:4'-phosphopantetheinyl transferase